MYTAIIVPYRTAFVDETTTGWFYLEIFLDALFVVDLFVNFMSAVEINDEEVDIRFKAIAKNYMKGWFFLDLLACLPFQLLELVVSQGQSSGGYNKLLRLLRLPRLYRLLRILRLFKMSKLFKKNASFQRMIKIIKMNAGVTKLIKVAVSTLLLVHLMTCFWFLVAKFDDFNPDTWVYRIGIIDYDPWYQYLISCYW